MEELNETMECPECGNPLSNEQTFCENCYTEIEWVYGFPRVKIIPIVRTPLDVSMQQSDKMKAGNINCSCGQSFYVQSMSNSVSCIRCAKVHDISGFPEEVSNEPNGELVEEPQNGSEGV